MSDGMDAALCRILRPEPAPGDLRDALLIQARRRDRTRRRSRLRRILPWGLAALMLLVLGTGGAWLNRRTRATGEALAQAALSDFLAIRTLSQEEMEGPEAPPPGKGGCLRHPACLPQSCAGMALGCARDCRLRGQPAACYRLRDGGRLYVFPSPIPGAALRQGQPLAVAANYQASAWNEAGRGFVLVMARPAS